MKPQTSKNNDLLQTQRTGTAPVVSRVHAHGRTDNEDILERFSCELENRFRKAESVHFLFYQPVVIKKSKLRKSVIRLSNRRPSYLWRGKLLFS